MQADCLDEKSAKARYPFLALWLLALSWRLLPRGRSQNTPQIPIAACLACHSQPDLKSDFGHSVFVNPARHKASVHANLTCTTCHTDIKDFPHPAK